MKLEIRSALVKDLAAVVEIEKRSFTEPWSKLSFQQSLLDPACIFLVAEEEERLLGYAIGWVTLDELHIGNLAVHPQKRGGGIGKTLLSALISQVMERGCKIATLELRESNKIALNLYTKQGFKSVAIRKDYYSHPKEDAIVMLKEIGDGMV